MWLDPERKVAQNLRPESVSQPDVFKSHHVRESLASASGNTDSLPFPRLAWLSRGKARAACFNRFLTPPACDGEACAAAAWFPVR
jgi:hypothetical protein